MKNGVYRWFRAQGATRRDAQGVPLRVVGALTDITAEREAEAGQTFNAQKERLETSLREIGGTRRFSFAAGIQYGRACGRWRR